MSTIHEQYDELLGDIATLQRENAALRARLTPTEENGR